MQAASPSRTSCATTHIYDQCTSMGHAVYPDLPPSIAMAEPSLNASSSPTSDQKPMKSKNEMEIVQVGPELVPVLSTSNYSYAHAHSGIRFWMVFVALCVSVFLSALEFTAVSTALPTITHDLQGDDFVWVASAYALASTALLPASGGIAEVFGRRATILTSLALFALGSALCGAAQNMNWLIAARTVQGAGGGGILSLGSIILSDLVSLQERGTYNGLIGLTWACAAAMGPLVGGALSSEGQWRWLFYLNLPICGLAAILVVLFLRLRTPSGSFRSKIARIDWFCVLALTWGGVRYPWSDGRVLSPLILGLLGIGAFLFYEARYAREPIVPFMLLSNRTSVSGYVQNLINPIVMISVVYYMPTYYQACKGSSPTGSGVDFLGLSLAIGPALVITGASIKITKSYRVQLWIGWILSLLGIGILTTLHADTPLAHSICLPILFGVGSGIIYSATYFPVLAPLPISENAHALALFSFCRSFAAVWGVTIGSTILQTQLKRRLPAAFLTGLPGGAAIAFSAIPVIGTLPEPMQGEVREAFAGSIIIIWQVMVGIAGIGLLASFAMKGLPLHAAVDEKWGIHEPDGRFHDSIQQEIEIRNQV
ncbi:hypothetical protein NM688_g1248 [Phlebia brevispora]|uniref:Uncharacterized protein n=1 Tax=Phlebia brevispora TaxID=194682 RepID=A0ACC1TC18_9APHY|nr:hypothetical protein NM688_g1248 [Phlebia brevispora]